MHPIQRLLCITLLLPLTSTAQDAWKLQLEGQYKKALTTADADVAQARAKHQAGQLHDTTLVKSVELAGLIHYLQGDLSTAKLLREDVVKIRSAYYRQEKTSSYIQYMDALGDLALVCFYLGHLEETAKYMQQASALGLRFSQNPGDIPYRHFYPYIEVAVNYQMIGELQKAESIHKQAIAFYESRLLQSKKKINTLAAALANKTDYYYFEQYYYAVVNCLQFYQNAGLYYKEESMLVDFEKMVMLKQGASSPNYGLWVNTMAAFYAYMGRYNHALKLIQEADRTFLGKENTPTYGAVLNHYGMVYWFKNDFVKAEEYYKRALKVASKGAGLDYLSEFIIIPSNLAFCYYKNGDPAKALKKQLEVLRLYESNNKKDSKNIYNHGWYQTMLMHVGLFYQAQKKYDSAEVYLAKALRHNVIRYPQRIQMARYLGEVYGTNGKIDQARDVFLSAFQLHFNMIDQNFTFFSERERSDMLRDMEITTSAFERFVFQHVKKKPSLAADLYAVRLRTKSVLFNSSQQVQEGVANSGDTVLINQYQQWKYGRDRLARYYQLSESERKAQGIDLQKLEAMVNDLEKKIAQKSVSFSSQVQASSWQEVQQKLQPDEAAIEIIRAQIPVNNQTQVKYGALLLTRQSEGPAFISIPGGDSLENRFYNYYRNCIQTSVKDNVSYSKYWSSIARQLGSIKRVFVSLDGVYNKISLRTLLNTDTDKFLSEECDVQIVGTTNYLVNRSDAKIKLRNIVLFGFPDYSAREGVQSDTNVMDSVRTFLKGTQINQLPGTKKEVNTINDLLNKHTVKTSQYLGVSASESNIKLIQSPQVLHIATHGFFLPDVEGMETFLGYRPQTLKENPLLRSGLLLSNAQAAIDGTISTQSDDGILTAYEAMNLDLIHTELVILSACETGLGEIKNGEGVYGLQRAFQAAGAKSVLMSLWKVDDTATQELMVLFYENLLKAGDKQLAFNLAQKQLSKKYPDPKLWGAFVYLEK